MNPCERLFWCLAWMALAALPAAGWAQSVTTGTVGVVLAQNLYCDFQGLMEGYFGLFLGFVLMVSGFWMLINGAKLAPSLTMIVMGGLVTALPSLINATLEGTGALLEEADLVAANTFQAMACGQTISRNPYETSYSPTGSQSTIPTVTTGGASLTGMGPQ